MCRNGRALVEGVFAAALVGAEYLKGRVSRFEQPRDIHILSSLPRNPAGKVVRKELPT